MIKATAFTYPYHLTGYKFVKAVSSGGRGAFFLRKITVEDMGTSTSQTAQMQAGYTVSNGNKYWKGQMGVLRTVI